MDRGCPAERDQGCQAKRDRSCQVGSEEERCRCRVCELQIRIVTWLGRAKRRGSSVCSWLADESLARGWERELSSEGEWYNYRVYRAQLGWEGIGVYVEYVGHSLA